MGECALTNHEYDVIVLGTEIAGLSVALAAHEKGLRPLVIEKADKVGGGTTNSYGLIWVGNNHLAQAAGYEDDRGDIINYMRFLAGGEANDERSSGLCRTVTGGADIL